jgi:hypothetical protein
MKWVLLTLAVVGLIIVIAFAVGALLPRDHVAASTATIPAPQQAVFDAITDVQGFPKWRGDVATVEVLEPGAPPARWRETGKFGPMTYERVAVESPRRFETRIADTGIAFGGGWTFAVEPQGNASRVTITERGSIYNPAFRFMSKFIFGYYGSQEAYLRALGKRFGGEVTPTRMTETR